MYSNYTPGMEKKIGLFLDFESGQEKERKEKKPGSSRGKKKILKLFVLQAEPEPF